MKLGVAMLAFNNLELSKMAVASIQNQDVGCHLLVINNDSTDGTKEWLDTEHIDCVHSDVNLGITAGWNTGLDIMFNRLDCDFVLVPNNDVVLPRWFLRELVAYDEPLVTGIDTEDIRDIMYPVTPHTPLVPYPDFSAFVIKRSTWETVGEFDERMFNYASDCDYHVRAHRSGLKFWKATVRYYHQRSSTINLAPQDKQPAMHAQADRDREVFRSTYGCLPGTKEYLALLDLV